MKRALVRWVLLILLVVVWSMTGFFVGRASAQRDESAWYSDLSRALATERRIGRNDAVIQIREYLGVRGETAAKRLVLDWWSEQLQKERQSVLNAGAEAPKGEGHDVHD